MTKKREKVRLRHVHSSGRYDRPKRSVRSALEAYAAAGAKVITLTEYHGPDHRAALLEFAMTHSWTVAQDTSDDRSAGNGAILLAPGYRLVQFWSPQLTDHEQRRGPGGPKPPHAATALVEHDPDAGGTGIRFVVSVVHLPPNVEGDFRRRGPFKGAPGARGGKAYRVWLWLTIVAAWKAHLRAVRKAHGVKRRILVADFNLNLERRWVRNLLRARFPGLKVTWRRFPGPGTHHKRVIDATLTNLTVIDPAALMADDPSSDHRPYVETLGL